MTAGGVWDTKHLVKCLPQVTACLESTSLGPLYEAMGHVGVPQAEVVAYKMHFIATSVISCCRDVAVDFVVDVDVAGRDEVVVVIADTAEGAKNYAVLVIGF